MIAAAAAVHPLDRDRRHADPGRLGDRRDHAAAGAALACSARGSTASACCRSASSTRAIPRTAGGAAGRTSSCAGRWPIAAAGLAIVGVLLFYGAPAEPERGAGQGPSRAPATRSTAATALAAAGISPGVMKPFVVLVEHGAEPRADRRQARRRRPASTASSRRAGRWQKGAEQPDRGVPVRRTARRSRCAARSTTVRAALKGTDATLGGVAPEDRDFVNAVYSNFPYVLAFVILLTFILLARAFRSLVLALKAAILNLDLARRGLRDHRLHLPAGPRLGGDLERRTRPSRSSPGSR